MENAPVSEGQQSLPEGRRLNPPIGAMCDDRKRGDVNNVDEDG